MKIYISDWVGLVVLFLALYLSVSFKIETHFMHKKIEDLKQKCQCSSEE